MTQASRTPSNPAASGWVAIAGRAWNDEWLFGALLFVGALAPRLAVGLLWTAEPVWDGHYYDFAARRIAEGHGYSDDLTIAGNIVWHPWCHYPVGYSAFLAAFYRLFGHGHAVAAAANALVGAALAVVTWALARHAMPSMRARIAGAIVAVHPGLVFYAALTMTEPLAALLTMVAFLLAVRSPRALRGLAVGGLTLGLAALVRPQALLCAPFLGLLVAPPWRNRVFAGAAACAIALVPVLPWTARNCRVMDGCALVSTNGGWNLAIGAFPRATGRFETLRSSDGCREVTGQVQQDRCWFTYGLAQIREHPIRWLSLVPAKLGFTFDHESFAVEYLHEARPDAWPEARREAARDATTLAHRILLAVASLGCVAFPVMRNRREAATQGALLLLVAGLGALALWGERPAFWPLAVFLAIVPWLPYSRAARLCASNGARGLATRDDRSSRTRSSSGKTATTSSRRPILALFAAHAHRPRRTGPRGGGPPLRPPPRPPAHGRRPARLSLHPWQAHCDSPGRDTWLERLRSGRSQHACQATAVACAGRTERAEGYRAVRRRKAGNTIVAVDEGARHLLRREALVPARLPGRSRGGPWRRALRARRRSRQRWPLWRALTGGAVLRAPECARACHLRYRASTLHRARHGAVQRGRGDRLGRRARGAPFDMAPSSIRGPRRSALPAPRAYARRTVLRDRDVPRADTRATRATRATRQCPGAGIRGRRVDPRRVAPYAGIPGHFRYSRRVEVVPGVAIEVALVPAAFRVDDDAIARWVARSARTIARFFGCFPVSRVMVLVAPAPGAEVHHGETMGDGGASIVVELGERAEQAALDADWILPHEMTHLVVPSVSRTHHWIEEGLAVYFEPIARARVGLLPPEQVWLAFARGLPQGLPTRKSDGLDGSSTRSDWRRTYWGGALYCLLADLEIRRRTGNRLGLDDAVRGVLAEGGSVAEVWPFERLIDAADAAVGFTVLRSMHDAMGCTAWGFDLPRLLRDLGVRLDGDHVTLVDDAPLATFRLAITAPLRQPASTPTACRYAPTTVSRAGGAGPGAAGPREPKGG